MSDNPFHEAVEDLRAIDMYVEPTGDDLSLWLVDGKQLCDADLIALARLLGLLAGPKTIH